MDKRFLAFAATGALAITLIAASAVVWLDGGSASGTATDQVERGRLLFHAKSCVGCHRALGVDGANIGPDLTLLPDVAAERVQGTSAEQYVRESIAAPDAFIVPGYGGSSMPRLQLTDDELEALVIFLLREQRE